MLSPFTRFPVLPSEWSAFLAHVADERLAEARAVAERLKDGTPRDTLAVLTLWNDLGLAIGRASAAAHLLAEVHPDPQLREAAERAAQAATDLSTELGLDAGLHAVLAATSADGLDAPTTRLRAHILRDFRRAGVDLGEADRAQLRALAQRCTELGLAFSRNIREGARRIRVRPEQLDGLPEDFRAAHPADDTGLVTLTTEYPDLVPVRTYARDRQLRRELSTAFLSIGWPENVEVLVELLRLRAQRAALLGYPDWPTYDAEIKMIGSGQAIGDFIDRLDALCAEPARRDVAVLLARLRRDDPDASVVDGADNLYLETLVRREQYDVDAETVRSYLRYPAVLQGVLGTVAGLLGLRFGPVTVPTWHPSVEVLDVFDVADGGALGRIYLDMHPRPGKFNHAAQFPLVPGVAGRTLPEAVLVCNFPTGLMEHSDVVTFFHEFGHLVHDILGGAQRWTAYSGVSTEWDFVEAPSMLLEEWAWDSGVLATFARDESGQPIPDELVARMRAADAFGRGAWTRRQLNFTALSYGLHASPPADLDAFAAAVDERFGPYASLPGSHRVTGFGHLDSYGSAYYTYLWSLVIAKDLRTAFGNDLDDPAVGRRFRDLVLAPGGSIDAADLVAGFLGRATSFTAFEAWLAGGTG